MKGECITKKTWMYKNCRKSCQLCEAGDEPEDKDDDNETEKRPRNRDDDDDGKNQQLTELPRKANMILKYQRFSEESNWHDICARYSVLQCKPYKALYIMLVHLELMKTIAKYMYPR